MNILAPTLALFLQRRNSREVFHHIQPRSKLQPYRVNFSCGTEKTAAREFEGVRRGESRDKHRGLQSLNIMTGVIVGWGGGRDWSGHATTDMDDPIRPKAYRCSDGSWQTPHLLGPSPSRLSTEMCPPPASRGRNRDHGTQLTPLVQFWRRWGFSRLDLIASATGPILCRILS